MNKFTKLLSIFVIAGAVGTGAAAFAGCTKDNTPVHTHTIVSTDNGDGTHTNKCTANDMTETTEAHVDANSDNTCDKCGATITPAHTHTAVKHDATPATCKEPGNIEYYTCDSEECAGKYYSDSACTQEITLASTVVPATGVHTPGNATDNGDGTHSATCSVCGDPISAEAHTDSDHDGKCDVCGATVAGTYVAEVPATCKASGMKAYYKNGDGSDGKYYSDCNLKNEVTADSLVIAQLAHTLTTYTPDSTYAKHSATCSECETPVTEACVDEDKDGLCDVCGADLTYLNNAFSAGAYLNDAEGLELIIGSDNSVSYTPNSYSSAKTGTLTVVDAETATFDYEFRGETYTVTLKMTKNGLTVNGTAVTPAPETIASSLTDFVGVYNGDFTYTAYGSTYKVTQFAITESGKIIFTEAEVLNDEAGTPLTTLKDASTSTVKYNKFNVEGYDFTATKADEEYYYVTEVTLSINGYKGVFTLDENEEVPTVPTSLPLEANTTYSDDAGNYTLSVSNYITLNDYSVTLLSKTNNDYLIYVYLGGKSNFVLSVSGTTVELKKVDGASVATLTLVVAQYPELKDGTNSGALVDSANVDYAAYKVAKTGYYTITAGTSDITFYTEVENGAYYLDSKVTITAGSSKTLQLTADNLLGVSASQKDVEFTVAYSETEPVVEVTYKEITSPYTISGFTYGENYYLQYTVPSTGTYTITSIGSSLSHGAAFTVEGDDTVYGDTYAFGAGWATNAFSKELNEGDVLKMTFYMGTAFSLDFGNVTITIAGDGTESGGEGGGEETTFEGFTADQQGTYTCSDSMGLGVSYEFTLSENSVHYKATYDGNDYEYDLTDITVDNGTYTAACATGSLSFTLGDGTLTVTANNELQYGNFAKNQTATKASSGATFEGFTADQQGTYTCSDSMGLGVSYEFTLGENSVHYKATYDGNDYEYDLTDITVDNGTYTAACATGSLSFTLGDGTLTVTANNELQYGNFAKNQTATKASSGGETGGETEETFESFAAADQGDYVYSNMRTGDSITVTVGATTITYEYVNTYGTDDAVSYTLTFKSLSSGTYVFECADGTLEFTLSDGVLSVTSNDMPAEAVGSANSFDAELVLYVNLGKNEVTTSYFGNVYTFIASETGTYEFAFDSSEILINYNYTDYDATFTLELTEGETVELNCMSAGLDGTYTLTITKATTEVGGADEGLGDGGVED
ncbi:MAG: hypothetical protein ACI4MS_05190 [Candidatus Coproplasma sp.]